MATWRRGTLVLYGVAALRRFFTPPPRDFVPPVTGGTLPAKLVPDELLSAKGPQGRYRWKGGLRWHAHVKVSFFAGWFQRHLGEGAPVPTGRVHHLMGRCERQASRADLGELVSLGLMSGRWAWRDRHDRRRGDVPHRSPRRRIRTLRAFRPQTGRPAARLRRCGFQCSVGTGRPTGWTFLESAEGDPFGGPVAVRLGVGGWWSTVGRTRSV